MTRPIIRTHNIETNEIIDREMNDEEFAQYESDQILEASRLSELAAKAETRQALLNKLGITEEEAKLLLEIK